MHGQAEEKNVGLCWGRHGGFEGWWPGILMVLICLRDELNEGNVLMLIQIFQSIKFDEELFLNAFVVEEASR